MTHWSRSSRFPTLFESALQDYEKTTNISLAKHPVAEQLQSYQSVEPIITLQDQAREFGDSPNNDRIMKSFKNTISVLCTLAATEALCDAIDLVCPERLCGIPPLMHIVQSFPPAKAIQTALVILLIV